MKWRFREMEMTTIEVPAWKWRLICIGFLSIYVIPLGGVIIYALVNK